jgi:hypothetical protein
MSLPIAFPDWVPWWVPFVLLLPALLYALAFFFMPFSVIGVKNRLEVLEARLDEIQNEIRHLSLRLPAPEPVRQPGFDEGYVAHLAPRPTEMMSVRPPIPPAPHELHDDFDETDDAQTPPATAKTNRSRSEMSRAARSEPRLDWRK